MRLSSFLFVLFLGTTAMTAARHPTNYDEAKVGAYTLPDPLTLANGEKVTSADVWQTKRRPELLRAYEREVFGIAPPILPSVHVKVITDGEPVADGFGRRRHVVLEFGESGTSRADVVLYTPTVGRASARLSSDASSPTAPAATSTPLPVLLQIVFLRGLPTARPGPEVPAAASRRVGFPEKFTETGPIDDILRRGFAYATFKYTDVQPDEADSRSRGLLGEVRRLNPGTADAAEAWSAIGVWAWAASRVLDYLATDPALDAHRVALIGHSRLGKTALWASAADPRFALTFASCSGEMGAALSRRDYGETIDDIAVSFPWWFCGGFQKYIGHWDDLPVDAHSLIALSAPRPVFITAGTEDQWADPRGEFLAAVATEPVYRLFGRRALGTTEFPAPDHPLLDGQIGWLYHAGPHAITHLDWQTFLAFAEKHLK